MYRTLLVPLDASPFGEQALPLACTIAQCAGAALHLVHVHQCVGAFDSGSDLAVSMELDADMRQQQRAYLERLAARAASQAGVRVTAAVLEGPIKEALHEQALLTGADLIVMTTHGRGPLTRLWLGSVADRLIRSVSMPVLLVRPRETTADLTRPWMIRRVIIPLDGSPLAEQILTPATELATLVGARLTLVQVLEPLVVPDASLGGNAMSGLDPGVRCQLEMAAQHYLDGVAAKLRTRGLEVQTRVMCNLPAALAILAEADAHGDPVITLATHARGGLARLLLGSVADKVLRGATVPVLVYRPLAITSARP